MNILKYITEVHTATVQIYAGLPSLYGLISPHDRIIFAAFSRCFFYPAASNRKISNTKIIELDDVASNNLMMKSTSFCHVNTR